MLSVWPKTAQLYLSRRLMLIKPVRGEVQVLPVSNGSSWEQSLHEVQTALGKCARVQIHLSAACCAAFAIRYPDGVAGFSDQMTFAHAVGASHLGLTTDTVMCEIDAFQPTLAAFLPLAVSTCLQQWAKEHALMLTSLRPLWSVATHCRLARNRQKTSLLLQEPDSLSLFKVQEESGAFEALSVPLLEDTAAAIESQRQEMLQSLELHPEQVLQLGFGLAGMPALHNGPRIWPSCWRLL